MPKTARPTRAAVAVFIFLIKFIPGIRPFPAAAWRPTLFPERRSTVARDEADLRLDILNSFLTTPHRNLESVRPVHAVLAAKDPRFYVRLAAWYADHGDVRDHQEAFVVTLVLGPLPGHRDAGLALLRGMPPYQVLRVIDFINGKKESVRVKVEAPQDPTGPAATAAAMKAIAKARAKTPAKPFAEIITLTEEIGLFRSPPRSLRTEITRYLREREADAEWFDASALVARKAMKRLYALFHVKPGPRAQAILFDDAPPADSKLSALKAVAKAATEDEQAELLATLDVPFRVAIGAVRAVTPKLLAALVGRMSPQDVINNLDAVRRRCGFDDPVVKALIDAKLDAAKTTGRVSAFKASASRDAGEMPADVKAKLDAVADARVKARGRISRPTALLVDKSGSMEQAIELGKRIGAMLAAVAERELYVYAFDTVTHPIVPAGQDLANWEDAFRGVTAGGGTSLGAAVELMRKKRQAVEQFVVVTDEDENTEPRFAAALLQYRQELGLTPTVVFVKTPGAKDAVELQCKAAGIPADAYPFAGDYYSLPNLIPLLARPSRLDLLQEVLEYPVPVRKSS